MAQLFFRQYRPDYVCIIAQFDLLLTAAVMTVDQQLFAYTECKLSHVFTCKPLHRSEWLL